MLRPLILMSIFFHFGNLIFRDGIITRLDNFENKIMNIDIINIFEEVDTSSKCSVLCLEAQNCISVFYRKEFRRCQLHDVIFMSPQDGQTDNGTNYYSLNAGLCPIGYVNPRNLGICYRHVLKRTKRDECVSTCASRGEHLLVIDSQEKQKHFFKQVSASTDAKKHNYFIDGSVKDEEDHWKFHDDRNMTFFSWCPSNPFIGEGEYLIVGIQGCKGKWRNSPGRLSRYFICEKDI